MIKTEIVDFNGIQYEYTYSDEHRYVVRDEVEYEEAYDPMNSGRTYTEGSIIVNET